MVCCNPMQQSKIEENLRHSAQFVRLVFLEHLTSHYVKSTRCGMLLKPPAEPEIALCTSIYTRKL